MSTQHIEEADVLANRICVMSHGKVIALDTPNNIKRRFGVGYNVFIEPVNVNDMNPAQIKALANRVRQAALTNERGINGIRESKDSINKRLIFMVPFSEVDRIHELIRHFEDNFPELQIDVEMNSLEDAYVKMVEGENKDTRTESTASTGTN